MIGSSPASRLRTDLGRRVELVSMDPHHLDISIGLYLREAEGGPVGTVHSYSTRGGTAERLAQIASIMRAMVGLEPADDPAAVRFGCGTWHGAAARRLFLEACKRRPDAPIEPALLEVTDSRTQQRIVVLRRHAGTYEVQAHGVAEGDSSRAPAIGRAIARLAELETSEDGALVTFPCGAFHDELIALLLERAQNLRAILREEELQANRGVLSAPSAQE